MRVSVVNFCSNALEMLKFSTQELILHAGTDDFDYIVVTWNPSQEVQAWLDASKIKQVHYKHDPNISYVPNIRRMMNSGFDAAYAVNDYSCIINSDMAFGRDWLLNLARRATENVIPNSLHISPIKGPGVVTANFGIPEYGKFDAVKFQEMHDQLYSDKFETVQDRGGWQATQTFPYVMHRKWWKECGPWGLEVEHRRPAPDRQFFERVYKARATYIYCHDSICYHHEAVERRGNQRPVGCENMPEGK